MREQLRSGIAHVGQALRTAEEFAVAWNEGQVSYRWWGPRSSARRPMA